MPSQHLTILPTFKRTIWNKPPNIDDKFVDEIIAHAEVLKDYPEIGRIVPEFDEPKIRERIPPPFRIVYWLYNQAIHVIRIWRSERLLQLPDPN
ncbi:MAG: type II toxin-antitoxin system RelE/ParE family toxin [Gammaproteobacteria bacterium]